MNQQSHPKRGSIGLTIIILLVSTGIAYLLLRSGPEVSPDEETPVAKMVKVREVEPDRYPVFVSAYGTVIPAQRVTIEPEVTGLVIRQHQNLTPGGRIKKGEELFTIDPTMTDLALKESEAALRRANVNLKEAQRKFKEAQNLASNSLIPDTELTSLEADALVQEAEVARLAIAMDRNVELLKRHVIKAPFNAMVLDEELEIGQRIDPGFSAATLIGDDEYWIQVSLPVDQIRHIQLPEDSKEGAQTSIFLTSGGEKQFAGNGRVIGLRGDVEREGRMARLLVSFPNTARENTSNRGAPLLIGSYVRVDIAAGEIDNCLAIHQASLRTNDRIWVVDASSTLQIRDVKILWSMDDMVYVSNAMQPGETLIVSPLRSAVPGTVVKAQPMTDL